MHITQAMKRHGIERIVFVPASDLVPHDAFHAWTFDGYLAEHCGRGATVEEAIQDAVARMERIAA